MQISVEATGIEQAVRDLDPKRADLVLIKWFDGSTQYVKRELSNRAPKRLQRWVRIMTDRLTPPHWARVYVKSPLAHLIEGGTGPLGAAGFKHSGRFFPRVTGQYGIMQTMGLPQAEAFLVARAIALRGGNPARPFIQPTFLAVQGRLVQMAEEAAREVWRETG